MTEEKALNIVEKTINKVYEKIHLLENEKEVLTVENNKLKKQLSLLNSSLQLKSKDKLIFDLIKYNNNYYKAVKDGLHIEAEYLRDEIVRIQDEILQL